MPDVLTPEQRFRCMQANRGSDTSIEVRLRKRLFRRGLRYRLHRRDVPGRPDIVFPSARVAVFVDGDFWHGYRFDEWRHKLTPLWADKIAANRERDQRNARYLRSRGWYVIRIWEHQIKNDLPAAADRVEAAVRERRATPESL
jgi:DNA mismatch endonuclease (patch repair protein)